MNEVMEQAGKSRARGLDRAFEILQFLRLHHQPLRPNEIAQQIGAPRSSVYELVNLLLQHGMLEYKGGDGRVFLGRKLYFLGMAYAETIDLMREANNLLTKISEETRETAQLCLLDGNKYTVAQMKEGIRPFRISSNVGDPVPIPWTASGRLLVLHMSDAEILDFIPKEDFKLPNGDVLDQQTFIAEVRQAARDGYFTFDSAVDTFTYCFAVPVFQSDRTCIATLCLVTPKEDGLKNKDVYLQSLTNAASDLSGQLGYVTDGIKAAS